MGPWQSTCGRLVAARVWRECTEYFPRGNSRQIPGDARRCLHSPRPGTIELRELGAKEASLGLCCSPEASNAPATGRSIWAAPMYLLWQQSLTGLHTCLRGEILDCVTTVSACHSRVGAET